MQLKAYQQQALDTLKAFLDACRLGSAEAAYQAVTEGKPLGAYRSKYAPLKNLEETPYACLRLPTGGGKTLLAAHAVKVASQAYTEKDVPIVLWLTPSSTIQKQTAEALKDARHPYRQALDEQFGGQVRVFDIQDVTNIRPQDLSQSACVVVGTIQSLRVEKTEGRKIYAHNENFEPHFAKVPNNLPYLEKSEDGQIKFSFANLLAIHQPILIVDEAHNAVTGLTREMQQRIRPACVIEFTATPKPGSNVIYSVSAQELKAAEMIKLPIVLTSHQSWQSAINGAIHTRNWLAAMAEKDSRFIRPIALLQAQNKGQEVTVDVLKRHLMENENISEEKIAIATGEQRELDGINLFDPACPIEYVITIEALKEGWDCSFAYVFCSVARIQSATAVEQLLGRVLRMPYAQKRSISELNRAYAHLSEQRFMQAAESLKDKLVSMGFEEEVAEDNVLQGQLALPPEALGPQYSFTPPDAPLTVTVSEAPNLELLPADLRTKVTTREVAPGEIELEIKGDISEDFADQLAATVHEPEREMVKKTVNAHRKRMEAFKNPTPFQQGEQLAIPYLCVNLDGMLQKVDSDVLLLDWNLLDTPAQLSPQQFDIQETASTWEIDLDGNKIRYSHIDDVSQQLLDVFKTNWTETALVAWLDRQVRQSDIRQTVMLEFCRRLVQHLLHERKLPFDAVIRAKFLLAKALSNLIADSRSKGKEQGAQGLLFAQDSPVELDFSNTFKFDLEFYSPPGWHRDTGYKFKKNFFGPNRVGEFDGEDERACAIALDTLPEVKYWVRNIARQQHGSFWLPTSKDRFYPDFVAELNDGRILVVEYKGAHLADNSDTQEKRNIGAIWASKSGGKCLFMIAEKFVNGLDVKGQIAHVIKMAPVTV